MAQDTLRNGTVYPFLGFRAHIRIRKRHSR